MKTHIKINGHQHFFSRTLFIIFLVLITPAVFAQDRKPEIPSFHDSMYTEPMFIGLILSAIFLLILIMVLGEIVKSTLHHRREMDKREKEKSGNNSGTIIGMIALLLFSPMLSYAQEAASVENTRPPIPKFRMDWYGLDGITFWTLIIFIVFEIIIALFFLAQIRTLLGTSKKAKAVKAAPSILERFNASVAIEEEHDILLDHDYDGIKELDNDLPPWWKYGFYFTIVWAGFYLVHYHVLKTGDLQIAEYNQDVADEAIRMEEYKKKSANLVDENNVTFLSDASSIEEGKGIYIQKDCKACHGAVGEGTTIAPNLTDDYWIHGGSIKDVFVSIRDGWTEKGMKAWGKELNPHQVHVLASYVKSLRGTNPANAKAPQGDLYVEEGVTPIADTIAKDTTSSVADTLK